MPLKRITQQPEPQPLKEQEELETAAKRPRPETVEVGPVVPGRPYQAFVESKLRQYLRDNNFRSLVKPTRQEIRAAAMPILCQAMRNRPGNRRYHSAAAMVQHAMERGWIQPPYSNPYRSQSYIDTLVQLADDTNWLAREIPLPEHPDPQHPTIYYTIDQKTGRPVPRADSYIRGDYVYRRNGSRITRDSYIYPWRDMENFPGKTRLIALGWDACYSLVYDPRIENVAVLIDWISLGGHYIRYLISPIADFIFSPHPPSISGTGRL